MKPETPVIPENTTPVEILRIGIAAADGPVSLACSFTLEDIVIIDMAHEAGLPLGVFALDTGRLNEETYEVADAVAERYRLKIDWYFPRHEEMQALERAEGLFSFRGSLDNSATSHDPARRLTKLWRKSHIRTTETIWS